MSSPALQLDVENALKSYLGGITLFDPAIEIIAAHATEKPTSGTYLAIIAQPADWYLLGGYNAQLIVGFEFATQVSDPDARTDADDEHSERVGALIDLLSLQRFNEVLEDLNTPSSPWEGIGFSGWDQDSQEEERSETQVVTRVKYEFVVHLEEV